MAKEANYIINIALFGSDFSELYDVSADYGKMNLNHTILDGPQSLYKSINYNFNLNVVNLFK